MLTFAEYLRQQRLSNGLTMQELAARLEVSPQFISLLESGKRHPSDKLVQRCARVFDEDLNYLRFLAQPIPEAQKRALFESPSAPDYIPRSMRSNVLVQDSDDVLMEAFLDVPGLPKPEEDTPYHFSDTVRLEEESFTFQRTLINHVRTHTDRFPLKVKAWVDFYDAYYQRHLEGRIAALPKFEALNDLFRTETSEAYPQRLRFLTVLHLGQAYVESDRMDAARKCFNDAHDRAVGIADPGCQVCVLWLLASLERSQGDLIAMVHTLEKALAIPDIPPFGIARCRTDAVEGYLAIWENEAVIEYAEEAIKLWRSSTLQAPQELKSLHLIRMEIAAFEAALRLEREEDARNWLSRVRSMRVRVAVPTEEEARIAVAAGTLLSRRGRLNQAKRHLNDVLGFNLPNDDTGRYLRAAAQTQLALIAVEEHRFSEAEELLNEVVRSAALESLVREVNRYGCAKLAQCTLLAAQDRKDELMQTVREAEQRIRDAVRDDGRLEDTPLVEYLNAKLKEWRTRAAA